MKVNCNKIMSTGWDMSARRKDWDLDKNYQPCRPKSHGKRSRRSVWVSNRYAKRLYNKEIRRQFKSELREAGLL